MPLSMLTVVVFFCLSSMAHAASDPGTPLIDFANAVMKERACPNCPEFVGQMIGANPITLGEIKDKSDIVVEDCHFTLVGSDTIRTASHCVRRWSKEWSKKADGDCSKAYRFYFPATDRLPAESADCAEIISPISLKSGLLQMEPDDVLVKLSRPLARGFAPVDAAPIAANDKLEIWGYDGTAERFEKRTCRRLNGSLLTPLDQVAGSAYATLTCDGNLSTGWSGDGVFVNGRLKGVVSFGLGQTTYGVSYFGENEVAVSQASCSMSGPAPLAPACLPTAEILNLKIHDLYASAIAMAAEWHESTRAIIHERFPYVELEFAWGAPTHPEFSQTPGYRARCFHRALLPSSGQILTGVTFRMDTFMPRFVIFNPDTTVAGVSRRDSDNPLHSIGEFNIGLTFVWADIAAGQTAPDCE